MKTQNFSSQSQKNVRFLKNMKCKCEAFKFESVGNLKLSKMSGA